MLAKAKVGERDTTLTGVFPLVLTTFLGGSSEEESESSEESSLDDGGGEASFLDFLDFCLAMLMRMSYTYETSKTHFGVLDGDNSCNLNLGWFSGFVFFTHVIYWMCGRLSEKS